MPRRSVTTPLDTMKKEHIELVNVVKKGIKSKRESDKKTKVPRGDLDTIEMKENARKKEQAKKSKLPTGIFDKKEKKSKKSKAM